MYIRTLKPLKTRKEKEELKFKSQGATNCRNHSDVIVSGVSVASPNSDVIFRNVEVNRPIARKRYVPRKQSLIHSEGSFKSSLRVCSRTFTFIALLLAIVISVSGGLCNIRLPKRKSTIGTSSSLSTFEPLVAISFRDSLFLSILRESSANILSINEGLCSCIDKRTFLNNNKQLIRCMEVLHNTIMCEERRPFLIMQLTQASRRSPLPWLRDALFANVCQKVFGGKTFSYIYITVRGLLGFPCILF